MTWLKINQSVVLGQTTDSTCSTCDKTKHIVTCLLQKHVWMYANGVPSQVNSSEAQKSRIERIVAYCARFVPL